MVENKKKYEQFGKLFGGHIHAIEIADSNPYHKNTPEELAIKVPAKIATIKSIEVNTIRKMKIEGGVDVVVVNGGPKEVTIGAAEKIIEKASDYSEKSEGKAWFGNYDAVNQICNAQNRAEAARLREIAKALNAEADQLDAVCDANDRAAAAYKEA